MEEFRIDCLYQTEEELVVTKELRQNIFRLNHTMPDTEEYRELLHKVLHLKTVRVCRPQNSVKICCRLTETDYNYEENMESMDSDTGCGSNSLTYDQDTV